MKCQEMTELLTALVDGELEGRERLDAEAHLSECPTCKNFLEIERKSKDLLRQTYRPQPAPAHLRARILNDIKDVKETVQVRSKLRALRIPLAAAALVLIVLGLFVVVNQYNQAINAVAPAQAFAQPLADHYLASTDESHSSFRSSDINEIETFFASRAGFTGKFPRITEAGFLVIGGYPCEVEHRGDKINVCCLEGTVEGHRVIVMVTDGNQAIGEPTSCGSKVCGETAYLAQHQHPGRTCTMALWKKDGKLFAMATDLGKDKVLALLASAR